MRCAEEATVQRESLHPLSKCEIDRRIESLMAEVMATGPSAGSDVLRRAGATGPRWITARDLVERMKRFIVHN